MYEYSVDWDSFEINSKIDNVIVRQSECIKPEGIYSSNNQSQLI